MSMKTAAWLVPAALIAVLIAYVLCREAVLFRLKDPSAVDPGDGLLVVLNPMRDRSPERAAERVLRQLQAGNCEQALSFVDLDQRKDNCEREREYRVLTWELRDRRGDAGETRVFFAVHRLPMPASPTNVWITTRLQRGTWVPVAYECWY